MTHHDHQHRQRGNMDWDEDDERGHRGYQGDPRRFGGRGSWVQDRGAYGGWASGEGQGEFAGDGYSAQGQFSNQRVAQYGDQGYGQEYGRQGIGWQNREDDIPAPRQRSGWGHGPSAGRSFGSEGQFGTQRQGPYGFDSGNYEPRSMRSPEGYGDWDRGTTRRLLGSRRRWWSGHWWERFLAAGAIRRLGRTEGFPGLRPRPELARQRQQHGLLGCRKLDGRASQWPRSTGLSAQRRPDRGGCLRASDPSRHA